MGREKSERFGAQPGGLGSNLLTSGVTTDKMADRGSEVQAKRNGEEKVDRGFLIGLLIVSIIFYSSFVNRQTKKKPTESGQEGNELK